MFFKKLVSIKVSKTDEKKNTVFQKTENFDKFYLCFLPFQKKMKTFAFMFEI